MKTYTYNLLKPFKYPINQIYFIWFGLFIASIGIPIILGLIFEIPFIVLTLWISLLIFNEVFFTKFLLKTELNGQISINNNFIQIGEKQITFESISALTLKPYISSNRSYIPQWKQCYELMIKIDDNTIYHLLVSKKYLPLTIPILDVLTKIKQINKKNYEKIKLPNTTGFFTKKENLYST